MQAREQGAASVEKLHAEVAKQLGQDGPAGCFVSSLLQAMHYAAHTGKPQLEPCVLVTV